MKVSTARHPSHLWVALSSMILAFIVLVSSTLPNYHIFAAAKSIGSVTVSVPYKESTKSNSTIKYPNYNSSNKVQATYKNGYGGHWYGKRYSANKDAKDIPSSGAFYCIQPSAHINYNGNAYKVYPITDSKGKVLALPGNDVFADQFEGAHLKTKQQIQLLRILMMYAEPTEYNNGKYLASQILAWEVVDGERDANFNKVKVPSGKKGAKTYGNGKEDTAYKEIEKNVQQYIKDYGLSEEDAKDNNKKSDLPSFAESSQALQKQGAIYTTTITDTNNQLANFDISSTDKNLKFQQSGNQLTVSTSSPPQEGKKSTITLTSKDTSRHNGILYLLYSKGNKYPYQAGLLTKNSKIKTQFTVQTKSDNLDPLSLEIEKTGSDESSIDLSGAVFTMQWYKSGQANGTPDGTYELETTQNRQGKYVADLKNAEVVSGEDIPVTDVGAADGTGSQAISGFPDGSLLVISETTPPPYCQNDPTWKIVSGSPNATISPDGKTVQIKIQKETSGNVSSEVKLAAEDTITPHWDIFTDLSDENGANKINANQTSKINLTDTITIDNDSTGIDGASGTITGKVIDATTGKTVGPEKTITIDNVKPGAQYSQNWTVDISDYANTGKGTTLYADETVKLTKDGKEIDGSPLTEEGKDAPSQQIEIVSETEDLEMHTSLSSNGTTGKINRNQSTVLTDSVTLSGVSDKTKGTKATLISTLVGSNGQISTKTKEIELDNTSYSQIFDAFDSTDASKYPTGKPVYANEKITYKDANGQEQTLEENGQEEESQQVTFPDTPIPSLGTTLTNKQTQNQTFTPGGKISLVDTVSYDNLTAGESYTLEGTLMDKETQSELKDASGNPVTGKVTFTASAANGKQDMSFDFNIDANFDHEVVAYETLKDKSGKEIAVHKDINAITQTVTPTKQPKTPQISTSVKSKGTGDRLDNATKEVNLVDTVHYTGLEGNTKYVMQGTLMHRSTGTAIQKGGKDLTNTVEFTTTASGTGDVDVPFNFNAKDIQLKGQPLNLAGQDIVVFEKVYKPGTTTIIARHEDRNDTHQIVHFPNGHTNARDAETLTQNSNAGKKVTIKDVVTYNNLIPGKTYTMTGTAYRKDTGKPLTDHGNVVSNTISFTPSSANGSVVVPVTFDASLLQGKRIVMFESCKYKNYEVFVHADITDHDQTIYIPELHTVAANSRDGSHKVGVGNVKIADKVSYTNLIPGQEYTIEGVLMNKDTGKPATVNGQPITGTATFTAKQETGYQVVDFKVDTSKIGTKHLVVFETLYTGNHKEVGHHKDINDEDQAVIVTETVRTGGFPIVPVAVGAGVAVLGAGLYFVFRKKKHPHTTD